MIGSLSASTAADRAKDANTAEEVTHVANEADKAVAAAEKAVADAQDALAKRLNVRSAPRRASTEYPHAGSAR